MRGLILVALILAGCGDSSVVEAPDMGPDMAIRPTIIRHSTCAASDVIPDRLCGKDCILCGFLWYPCCARDTCAEGLGCVDPGIGSQRCDFCGGMGQPCCPTFDACHDAALECTPTSTIPRCLPTPRG